MKEHWVFAYGSLMWDPGFAPVEVTPASVSGYVRRFCLKSVVYRGTVEAPGLVLGLDAEAQGSCRGLALRVADADWPQVLGELRARELTTYAYAEKVLPLHLADGREVEAVAYVIDRAHEQYIGGLDLEAQARIIARASGGRGPNADYLYNTAHHLAEMGVEDGDIAALVGMVRGLNAGESPA